MPALAATTSRQPCRLPTPRPVFVMLAAFALLAMVGLRREAMWLVAPLYMLAFVGLVWTQRFHRAFLASPGRIIFWAILFRICLLWLIPAQVTLSDDYYRYIWDGLLTANGVNPFEFRPDSASLTALREGFPYDAMNSADKFSVYPPVSQWAFVLPGMTARTASFDAAFVLLKSIFVLMEMAGIAFLLLAANRRRSNELAELTCVGDTGATCRTQRISNVAWYAWNPLPIVAFAGNGHSEAGLVFGLGLAVWAVQAGRVGFSWLGLTLAGLSKLVPFVALPLWYKRYGWRGAWLGVLLCVVLTAPFWFAALPANYMQSLRLYVQGFEFNAPVYGTLGIGIKKLTWFWFCDEGCNIAGPLLAIVFLCIAVCVFIKHRVDSSARLWHGVMLLLSTYLLLATTVHPWYAIWPLVLVPVTPLLQRSWLWFSFASVLTYFSYDGDGKVMSSIHITTSAAVWLGFAWFAWKEFQSPLVQRILRRRGMKKAAQIQPYVEGRTVLDLGCGEGFVGEALASHGQAVTLCDVADMNQTALPFHVYDGNVLPFANDTFDTVVLSLVLHHCADAQRVIDEAMRVARCRVVITESTWESKLDFKLINFLDRRANRLRGGKLREQEEHLTFRTVEQWQEMIECSGWRLDDVVWLNRLVHKHVLFCVKPT